MPSTTARPAPSRSRSKHYVINFPPLRDHQRALYEARKRFNVWVCHRRFGKTHLALYQLIIDAYQNARSRPRYGYIAPLYRQGKVIAWDLLKHLTRPLPDTKINEAELRVDLAGERRIQIFGADNPDALRGLYLDGVVFDEFAQMQPRVWSEVVRPALADRQGWSTFISTPLGKNHFHDLYQQAQQDPVWHSAMYRVEDTGILSPEELASARQVMSPEQYAQEFECFPPETLVLTSRGASPIADIRVGDMVLTHRGRWRPVTQTMQRPYTGPMITLETWGGCPLVCTPDHPVLLANWREQTYRWAPAQMVAEGDYVCFPRHAVGLPLIPAELAALIAWYIAEGSIARNVVQFSLGLHEAHHAQTILDAALALGWKGEVRPARTALSVVIGSTQLADFLVMHCGRGSAQKQLPLPLISGHERLVWETLFAADGHVRQEVRWSKYTQQWYYTTVSEALALAVQTLGHTLGYQGTYIRRKGVPYQIEGRTGPSRESYSLTMRPGGNQSLHARRSPKLRQAKNAVVAKVRRVRRTWYEGTVHNLAVSMDESYTAYGRAVHNCSFESALIGSYYGSYLETAMQEERVTRVPWQPSVPVHVSFDLGISDATAIWFVQKIGQMFHFIDYLEASDHGLEWYAKVIKEKPYTLGRVFWPHDVDARDFSSDGRTRLAIAESLGLRPSVVVPRGNVADGIAQVRTMFPRFVFDEEKCYEGLSALKAYRREWNETRKDWSDHPLHDWCLMGDTAILTRNGKYRIMDLSLTGEVLTSCGWKAYHSPRITRRNAPLVAVVFNDGFTVKCTAEHLFKTASGWISAQHLQSGSVIQSCSIPSSSILTGFSTVYGQVAATFRAGVGICTSVCGKLFLASARLTSIFTTATAIPAIMRLATWNACPSTSILAFLGSSGPRFRPGSGLRPWPARGLRSGMHQRKDDSGIAAMHNAVNRGPNGHGRTSRVFIVGRTLRHWYAGKGIRSTVAMRANMLPILLALKPVMPVSMLRGLVSSVGRPLLRLKHAACIVKSTVARRVVIGKWCEEQVSKRKPTVLRVVQVRHLDERADVWCLTVPGLEEFALANGALVHNSSHAADSLRTFAVGYEDDTPAAQIPTTFYHPARGLWGRR